MLQHNAASGRQRQTRLETCAAPVSCPAAESSTSSSTRASWKSARADATEAHGAEKPRCSRCSCWIRSLDMLEAFKGALGAAATGLALPPDDVAVQRAAACGRRLPMRSLLPLQPAMLACQA